MRNSPQQQKIFWWLLMGIIPCVALGPALVVIIMLGAVLLWGTQQWQVPSWGEIWQTHKKYFYSLFLIIFLLCLSLPASLDFGKSA
ncbi:MAG: hypothetical protein AAF352_00250, partial [Pseudomonadota bacterium]